jgi:glycosyltransferase involved in cell wall biosynthesis
MGFDSKLMKLINSSNVQFFKWSEADELLFLNSIDIGIMPLGFTPVNQGKCGFKLIQYMAMGKPTISTPLEANIKINRDSNNLFSSNEDEWLLCIELFIRDLSFYRNVGVENRKIVEKYYSIENNYLKYVEIFNQIN